jgi:hypothetical protein
VQDTGKVAVEELIRYLEKQSAIAPAVDRRIRPA